MKVFTVILLCCAALSAQNPPWKKTGGQDQHQNQGQTQTQGQSQYASASASNSASNAGNAQSTTFNSQEKRQTPFAYAPEAIPTSMCRIGRSGGGSSPYFGFAIGGSGKDGECEKRLAAASFADIGNQED